MTRQPQPPEFIRPIYVQLVGIAGLIGTAVFWAITNRLEPTLVATFGGMLTYGGVLQAREDARGSRRRQREDDDS